MKVRLCLHSVISGKHPSYSLVSSSTWPRTRCWPPNRIKPLWERLFEGKSTWRLYLSQHCKVVPWYLLPVRYFWKSKGCDDDQWNRKRRKISYISPQEHSCSCQVIWQTTRANHKLKDALFGLDYYKYSLGRIISGNITVKAHILQDLCNQNVLDVQKGRLMM